MSTLSDQDSAQRFADEADAASALELRFHQEALRGALARGGEGIAPRFDGVHCIDCDAEIPAGRRALGKDRCIDCQEAVERRVRGFRR